MFISDRDSSRNLFFQVRKKQLNSELMEPLELLISDIISIHPEYHYIFDDKENMLRNFNDPGGMENPFLHMGLHIAVLEQINTNRPPGITDQYQRLLKKYQNEHQAQHQFMDCLQKSLWQAQAGGRMPDETAYLECICSLG